MSMVIIMHPEKKQVSYCAINRIQTIIGNASQEMEFDESQFTVDAFDESTDDEDPNYDYDEFDALIEESLEGIEYEECGMCGEEFNAEAKRSWDKTAQVPSHQKTELGSKKLRPLSSGPKGEKKVGVFKHTQRPAPAG